MQAMEVERTLQFVLETQARFAADLQKLGSLVVDVARNGAETARLQAEQAANLASLTEIVRLSEEDRRRAEEDRRRAEQENREAHRRYEEAHRRYELIHQETDERFSALIKMMDEWIRERRNNRHGQQPS